MHRSPGISTGSTTTKEGASDRLLRSYHLVRGEKGVRTDGGALGVWFVNLYSQPLEGETRRVSADRLGESRTHIPYEY